MYNKKELAEYLEILDLGSTVAEQDDLLQTARVETSTFSDLLNDKVDLIPGTKGSGKSALYRIFVDFLPEALLSQRKVVLAHGVQKTGDPIFLAYKSQFEKLKESEFVDFWLIYLTSLAHEQFIKEPKYSHYLKGCEKEIARFRGACANAHIPEFETQKSLKEILAWTLEVLSKFKPCLKYSPPGNVGEIELDLFGNPAEPINTETQKQQEESQVPSYASEVPEALRAVLSRCGLSVWLMIDKLDEVFPRRSDLETKALRGLLRAMKFFASDTIRVKIFLRDDMLEEIVKGGFTALTHITARQADTLRWSEPQILTMVVKRLFAKDELCRLLNVDKERVDASLDYRREAFYKVFPLKVHSGEKQSSTLSWIYTRTQDGKGVVTPRDVIQLISRAKQHQQDEYLADPAGSSDVLIGPAAIKYGLEELSRQKKINYLEAEFPHLYPEIKKFAGGKTEYSEQAVIKLLKPNHARLIDDLISIGFFAKGTRKKNVVYKIPSLYRKGLNIVQGYQA